MSIKEKFTIQTYNVGIIYQNVEKILNDGLSRGDIVWLKHKYKDRFFADPFLIDEDHECFYILVEEYCFWEEKGKIVMLKVSKPSFALLERTVLIEEETHLSFPFCEFRGNTIIPESVNSGKTFVYSFDLRTHRVTGKELLLDHGLIDASFYRDSKGDDWIFASNLINPKSDVYLYKKHGLHYNLLNEGRPIYSSIKYARSAGRFFTVNDILYRPVQDSTMRYGEKTVLLRIDSISNDGCQYTPVREISSIANPPFNETLHTFNVYDNCVIVDGSKDYCRFPMKAFYKARKKMRFK